MKKMLFIVPIILLAGCATPSKIIKKYQIVDKQPILVEEITEYDNSTFMSGKALRLSVGLNPTTKYPEVWLGYGRWESARIKSGQFYDSDFGVNDVNLFTGEGSAEHYIRIGPVKREKKDGP